MDLGEITSELVRGLHAEWGTEQWLSMLRAKGRVPSRELRPREEGDRVTERGLGDSWFGLLSDDAVLC